MDRVRELGHRPHGWWRSQSKTTREILAALLGVALLSIVLEQVFLSHSLNGLCLNLATELTGSVTTFILIDQIVGGTEEKRRLKTNLIAQMGSTVNEAAIRAVEELERRGWLTDGSMHGAHLESANLQGAHLYDANLQGTYLYSANLQGAFLNSANLQGAHLYDANLQGAQLVRANLQGADLYCANLQKADLSCANLQEVCLYDANLQGARLRLADLSMASLPEANLQGADLFEANLQEAHLEEVQYDENTVLPDRTRCTPDTDIRRFTDPDYSGPGGFWRSDDRLSPAFRGRPARE
jgi:uncharacterized protein YjbI with pentapeptide repeats